MLDADLSAEDVREAKRMHDRAWRYDQANPGAHRVADLPEWARAGMRQYDRDRRHRRRQGLTEIATEIIDSLSIPHDPWLLAEDGIIDEIAVEEATLGIRAVRLTRTERIQAMAEILAQEDACPCRACRYLHTSMLLAPEHALSLGREAHRSSWDRGHYDEIERILIRGRIPERLWGWTGQLWVPVPKSHFQGKRIEVWDGRPIRIRQGNHARQSHRKGGELNDRQASNRVPERRRNLRARRIRGLRL